MAVHSSLPGIFNSTRNVQPPSRGHAQDAMHLSLTPVDQDKIFDFIADSAFLKYHLDMIQYRGIILPSPIIACEQSVGRERGDILSLTNPPPLLHVSNQLEEKGVICYPLQALPHYCM